MTDDQGQSIDGSKGSSALKTGIIIVIAGLLGPGVLFVGSILGISLFTDANEGMALKRQIEGTPAIKTHIGQLDDLMVETGSGRIGFDVSGSKGSGYLWVETGEGSLDNADWAILEVDGKSHVVFGDPPADLGAETLPDMDGSKP
jgi:hypothetical protein